MFDELEPQILSLLPRATADICHISFRLPEKIPPGPFGDDSSLSRLPAFGHFPGPSNSCCKIVIILYFLHRLSSVITGALGAGNSALRFQTAVLTQQGGNSLVGTDPF